MVILDNTPSPISQAPIRAALRRKKRVSGTGVSSRAAQVVVVSVVALSPLPAGGNHPLAWLFWSTIFGFCLTLLAIRSDVGRVFRPAVNRRILKLAVAYFVFAGFQALPLPKLTGGLLLELPQMSILSSHISLSPGATMLATIRGCSYLLFFALVLFAVQDRCRAKSMGWVIFLTVAVHAVFGLVSLNFFDGQTLASGETAFPGAATGSFINKNSYATFLGLGLVLGLSQVQSEMDRRQSADRLTLMIGLAALAVISATLAMTQSRLGIAATVCAAILVIYRRKQPRGVKYTLAVAAAGAVTVLAPGFAQIGFFDLAVSSQTRIDLYRQVLGMISDRPLLGFGLDSFALAFEPYHRSPVTAEFVWDKAHSTYLTLWVEAGLLFGSVPIAIGVVAVWRLWTVAKIPERGRSLALAGVAALLLSALHSLGDFSLEIQANMFLLIAIVALGLAENRHRKGTN